MNAVYSHKKETLLIQQEDNHNKFWAAKLDEVTHTAHIRWGRLGTKGQSQNKTFSHNRDAERFILSKCGEKLRKGYKTLSQEKFDELSIQAAIVGTANKCHSLQWADLKDQSYSFINEDQLQSPNCNPCLFVQLETKKDYYGKHEFSLLFTFDSAYLIQSPDSKGGHLEFSRMITKSDALYELTQKVEEAIGRTLSK